MTMNEQTTRPKPGSGPRFYEAPSPHPLGEWLATAGIIATTAIEPIDRYANANNLWFGEAAVQLGKITQSDLDQALCAQFDAPPPDFQCGDGSAIVFQRSNCAAAEQFRNLRNALATRWFKHRKGARSMMVTGPTDHGGHAAIPANLAIAFAQAGFRTLLIDADLRRPSLHTIFDLKGYCGLSDILAGRPDEAAFHQLGSVPCLSVIPAGITPPNPQELLLRGRLDDLLLQAEARFEVILVNAPSAAVSDDYLLIGASAVGAMIVTVRGQTSVAQASNMVKCCREVGIRIAGSAMLAA
jgi:receptor protein-tyrosine kinase